jgi:hypothetical protein
MVAFRARVLRCQNIFGLLALREVDQVQAWSSVASELWQNEPPFFTASAGRGAKEIRQHFIIL